MELPNVELVERQREFNLLDSFEWVSFPNLKKRKMRGMVYTPDFILKVDGFDKLLALESKGYARKDYAIRKKLFIKNYNDEYYFLESNSEKHLRSILEGL